MKPYLVTIRDDEDGVDFNHVLWAWDIHDAARMAAMVLEEWSGDTSFTVRRLEPAAVNALGAAPGTAPKAE